MLLGFTTVRLPHFTNTAARVVHDQELPVDMETIFGDLPRMTDPNTGVDDTDKIREMLVERYPERCYCPDQTYNRRAAYMAIYTLRTKSNSGWRGDQLVRKGDFALKGGVLR